MTHIEAMKQARDFISRLKFPDAEPEPEVVMAVLGQAIAEAEGQEKALQALHNENERLGLYKDAYAEPDLIARLRDTASKGVSVWGDLMLEAAKEIEILTAERECYASSMDRMLAQTEQEPFIDKSAAIRIATALGWEPKREWVGLTNEEWVNALGKVREQLDGDVFGGFYRAIEAKLKQNNGY